MPKSKNQTAKNKHFTYFYVSKYHILKAIALRRLLPFPNFSISFSKKQLSCEKNYYLPHFHY